MECSEEKKWYEDVPFEVYMNGLGSFIAFTENKNMYDVFFRGVADEMYRSILRRIPDKIKNISEEDLINICDFCSDVMLKNMIGLDLQTR